jgi:glutaredoxin
MPLPASSGIVARRIAKEHVVKSLPYPVNIATSLMATALRTGMGIVTSAAAEQPVKLLELYEFEGCPHCRLVREVLTELDLDAQIYPCPKNGERFRPLVIALGGKAQFPFLVDANTNTAMYESADIIGHLFRSALRWRRFPATAAAFTPVRQIRPKSHWNSTVSSPHPSPDPSATRFASSSCPTF